MRILPWCTAVLLAFSGQDLRAETATAPLFDGFEDSDFTEAGGLYYRNNEEQTAGTVDFQQSEVRSGEGALRLSVRSNCEATDTSCSERAEIWEKTPLRVPYERGVWYGFSVKFDDPIPVDDNRYVIAQWKREIGPEAVGDFSPYLAFRVNEGRLFITVETNYYPAAKPPEGDVSVQCSEGQTPAWLRPETNQMRLLVATDSEWTPRVDGRFNACTDKTAITPRGNALPLPSSGWIDFAVFSKPGPNGGGQLEIFANGDWIVTVRGYIGHNDHGLGENQYFKFGPYRSGSHADWALFYDDFIRSERCEDVLKDAEACAAVGR
ncbi:polysaccharide lyase [Aliiroseovarius sp. YM-037]|uniref:polysaccharide lyase n=1 Tax=Aliiroseovarius sp. YM-037 TaxID=3341728 RepID=UPI003A808241